MKSIRLFVYFAFALFAFSLAGSSVLSSPEKINSYVFTQLEGKETVLVDVYVQETSRAKFDKIIERIDGEVIDTFYPEGFSAELSREQLTNLAEKDYIEGVFYSFKVQPALQDAVQIIDAVDAWEMEANGEKLTGTGQRVCVIDTGVDFTHPDLSGKGVFGECNLDCTADISCPLDCTNGDVDGHGTYVAGIVAASGGLEGVGKGADLIGLRVFEQGRNDADLVNVKRAVNWCVDNADQYDISVISMSLGTTQNFDDYCDNIYTPLRDAINNAVANKISVVASTGNDGDSTAIALPSCMSNAIPVAATNKDDTLWQYSNYNWMVKLFAPGEDINSLMSGGGYERRYGTSASTPMVSGAIAILNQEFAAVGKAKTQHPKNDIEPALFVSGDEISGLSRNSWSRINVRNALYELDAVDPIVALISPGDNSIIYTKSATVNFVCTADDWQLSELTLRVKDSRGREVFSEARQVSGDKAYETFIVNGLGIGRYTWNCEASDIKGNSAEAQADYNLRISLSSGLGRFVPLP